MTVELAPFILNNSDSFQPACHVFVCATDDDYLCVCIIGRRHIGRQPDGTKAASTRFVAQSTLRDHFQSLFSVVVHCGARIDEHESSNRRVLCVSIEAAEKQHRQIHMCSERTGMAAT